VGGAGRAMASFVEDKARLPGNELGLSGMDLKQETTVGSRGDDSYSSIGM